MATRYIRNTVILAKTESTVGTDPTPTGADNAILVSGLEITPLDAQMVDRDNIRGDLGVYGKLVGPAHIKCSFTVEFAGSGAADTAPAWGPLLLACATAEAVLETPDRVEYTPISSSLKTLTIYWYDDGALHKLHAVQGTFSISAKVGGKPGIKFDFVGLDGGLTAASNASPTLTAFQTPVAVKKATVVDITLGCTYSAGALSSGTVYNSDGLELMAGNDVAFIPLLTTEKVETTKRECTGKLMLELTAAQEASFMTTVKANTTQSLGFTLGTAAGNKIIVFCPAIQLTNPRKEEINGVRMIGYDYLALPTTGNNEFRIVTQ